MRTFTDPRSVAFIARLRATMGNKHWGARELASTMACEVSGLHQYLRHLMGATPRMIHIAAYRTNSTGRYAPLYRLGNRPDVECPRRPTNAERQRRRREKDPEAVNAAQRKSYMLRQAVKKPNGIFAALGL